MSGWYKQQRSISERPWFKDADVVQLYTFLKATAYVTDGKYEGQLIRRGSCPTTRPDMMEATGLSYKKVDKCLKVLVSYGEIIVKGNNKFSVITICDYDNLEVQSGLFEAYEELQRNYKGYDKGTTNDTATGTAHLLTIEERREDNKRERERLDVGLEIKKRYNKTFDQLLPPCARLTMPTKLMVEECIRRFGMQSVDLVFEQIKQEPFSLGQNKTGFIANFQYVFKPSNFQQYLERAQLRLRKKTEGCRKAAQKQETAVMHATMAVEPQLTKEEYLQKQQEERRERLLGLVALANKEPERGNAVWMSTLLHAYNSGELEELNIDWEPKIKH